MLYSVPTKRDQSKSGLFKFHNEEKSFIEKGQKKLVISEASSDLSIKIATGRGEVTHASKARDSNHIMARNVTESQRLICRAPLDGCRDPLEGFKCQLPHERP
jgi:hypothetical protein